MFRCCPRPYIAQPLMCEYHSCFGEVYKLTIPSTTIKRANDLGVRIFYAKSEEEGLKIIEKFKNAWWTCNRKEERLLSIWPFKGADGGFSLHDSTVGNRGFSSYDAPVGLSLDFSINSILKRD